MRKLIKQEYKVVGVMSGTSLDGIDLAEITFGVCDDGNYKYEFGATKTIEYSEAWRQILREAIQFSKGRIRGLNLEYTRYLAQVIKTFVQAENITAIDAICSHGHTIFHQPDKGLTLQIGNLPEIAELLGQNVVCDFRVQDVALGGQGAPLVPIGDRLLFSEYDYCLNLGGFANCSSEVNGQRMAYDICPVNILLNPLAESLGFSYDDQGKIARSGTVDELLLEKCNALPFYKLPAPKSLGLEWVKSEFQPLLDAASVSVETKIATITEHIAIQLANQFNSGSRVLVTGGGTFNLFLLERIRHYKSLDLVIPEITLIDFKEALVFGLLGVLRLRNEVNCLASVTGAAHDHCSGKVFLKPA